jgi:septal ring factor EnvC (AmiA/AmiB activator)
MNIIGKIFVFAVFVMSLVFMSFAIALFSTHTNWRDEITRTADQVQAGKPLGYKLQLEEAKKERETLTAEIAKLTAEVAASEAARDQVVAKIQTALEEKDKELQDLRKDKDAREDEREKAQSELAMARAELEKATKTVEDLRADIAKQQNTVNDAVARSAKLAGELHEKESFLEIATERKAQLEKQVANARLLLKQHGLAIESLPRDQVPTAGGIVTAVANDSIEVTLGGDDGVQMGHFLEVYRDDEYLGRVQVISVKPDRSVGRVIREFKRGDIQPGDRVATRLKA